MALSRPFDEDRRRGNVAKSIILKKYDFGEADELVVFLSRELGWLRGVAKNAKKSRIRFGGHLEPLSLVDFTLRPRKKDDLVWIDESQVIHGFLLIRSDIAKVARAQYLPRALFGFLARGPSRSGTVRFHPEAFWKAWKLISQTLCGYFWTRSVCLESSDTLRGSTFVPRAVNRSDVDKRLYSCQVWAALVIRRA